MPYDWAAVRAPVVCDPPVAFAPPHDPVAVQLEVLALDQEMVEAVPQVIFAGATPIDGVGLQDAPVFL